MGWRAGDGLGEGYSWGLWGGERSLISEHPTVVFFYYVGNDVEPEMMAWTGQWFLDVCRERCHWWQDLCPLPLLEWTVQFPTACHLHMLQGQHWKRWQSGTRTAIFYLHWLNIMFPRIWTSTLARWSKTLYSISWHKLTWDVLYSCLPLGQHWFWMLGCYHRIWMFGWYCRIWETFHSIWQHSRYLCWRLENFNQ